MGPILTVNDVRRAVERKSISKIADLFDEESTPCSWVVIHAYPEDLRIDSFTGHQYAIFWPVRHNEGHFDLSPNASHHGWSGGFLY